ncbi:hypothetical protein GCK72_011506 [Caenorhabditis remanei]|uniref:RING-type domain-containing protein n=1 Tax=Caenorhabditis remanei TaxID=31234 RepID=A0A6A5H5Z0_CAERE|nr:hypothetical protein GCK72_011506 [Caenorhabditis remanei]KAF1763240.1 hypothetical protein GCK72_011506 [Caenorhabditis remanei]
MNLGLEDLRSQHRHAARVFAEHLFIKPTVATDAQYQNLADLEPSGDIISTQNAHMFLPPNIDPKRVTKIEKVEVTTEIRDNKPVFVYQFKWFEKDSKEKGKKAKLGGIFTSGTEDSGSESSESEEPVPLVKKTSSMMKINGSVRCDGPCGKIVDQTRTSQFGCDHTICDTCLKKNPSAALFDGSPGCCNEMCVKMAGDKVCAGQSDSVASVCTQVGAVEMIPTHISILKNFGRDILRTQIEFEYSSSARLSSIIKSLQRYKDLLVNSRFYYSTVKPTRRSDLIPIALTDTNLRFYDIVSLESSNPVLYLAVVANGIQFRDSESP